MNRSSRVIKLISSLILAFGLVCVACKKKEIQGPKGDPGEPGVGGNSNIAAPEVFAVGSSQWIVDPVEDCYKATISFASLTKDVVEKGAIKVYVQTGSTWTELPFTRGDLFTQFGFDEGHLYLKFINIEGGTAMPAPAAAIYRLVIFSEI